MRTGFVFALKLLLLAFCSAPLALGLVAALLVRRDRRVPLSAVRALGCPVCRAELSEQSLKAADNLWQRHYAAIVEQNPGARFRLDRRLAAVCQDCGARLEFDRKTRTLALLSIVLAFEKDPGNN
jgi:hypothetical protein